jgi:ABC-type lipopolysaccharide export system ATPase subunit
LLGRARFTRRIHARSQGLFKSYGDRAVVADLSLDVGAGEIVGLLGRTAPASRRPWRCCAA